MSNGINKVILIGHIGADPEVRYTAGGDPVANFNLATTESFKNKSTGVNDSRTEWHRVTVFGKLADVVSKFCRKGSKIYVEGSNRTRKWEKDGQSHYTTEVVVNVLQLLDSKPSATNSAPANEFNDDEIDF